MTTIQKSDFTVQTGEFRSFDIDACVRASRENDRSIETERALADRPHRRTRLGIAALVRIAQSPLNGTPLTTASLLSAPRSRHFAG